MTGLGDANCLQLAVQRMLSFGDRTSIIHDAKLEELVATSGSGSQALSNRRDWQPNA
jgi:hypothetical protein